MKKVIMFDLDGTLLPVDTHQFVEESLRIMAEQLADYIEPQVFVKALWRAVEAVVTDRDPQKTNEQVFTDVFLQVTGLEKEVIWPAVDRFYAEVFPTLGYLCQPTGLARQIAEEAHLQGYRLVVATNPLYPEQAIRTRLQWAGVDHVPFLLITTYENCCFAKPNLEYYQFICDCLSVQPEQCIMVGNDMQEDMCAAELGMKTFLVEDWLIDRGEPRYPVDEQGSLAQLYERLRRKQGIFA
jgi:FMN phosphatase YigB (HAD superfamily)